MNQKRQILLFQALKCEDLTIFYVLYHCKISISEVLSILNCLIVEMRYTNKFALACWSFDSTWPEATTLGFELSCDFQTFYHQSNE